MINFARLICFVIVLNMAFLELVLVFVLIYFARSTNSVFLFILYIEILIVSLPLMAIIVSSTFDKMENVENRIKLKRFSRKGDE